LLAQKDRLAAAVAYRGVRRHDASVKKLVTILLVAFLAQYAWNDLGLRDSLGSTGSNADVILAEALENRQSNLQVQGKGTVVRVLSDDNDGSRHQRFILKLNSGQTLLMAHNIDLAQRVNSLRTGDTVEFFGEYEWNAKGGVIHWTHHDPQRAHVSGWLKHQGNTYQ